MTPVESGLMHTLDRLVRPERYSVEQYEEARLHARGWSSSVVWLRAIELYNWKRANETETE